ncbi:MAG: sigma-70 family RNA polymerase sigma factor [Bacteroidetes bacterium]|nr:sigma-70 family RNA polymerase sigma factor [Bacteroidota bacterium]
MRQFAVLVDQYKDRAVMLAFRFVRNREEAEELVQDAFVRSYHALHTFRGDSAFRTWFYRILYNLCMTRVARKGKRVPVLRIDDSPGLTESIPDEDAVNALEQLEEKEMAGILSDELLKLPDKYRIPLTLFYTDEMTYEEIGEITGAPLGTVKTNLFRGRHLLREKLTERLREEVFTP